MILAKLNHLRTDVPCLCCICLKCFVPSAWKKDFFFSFKSEIFTFWNKTSSWRLFPTHQLCLMTGSSDLFNNRWNWKCDLFHYMTYMQVPFAEWWLNGQLHHSQLYDWNWPTVIHKMQLWFWNKYNLFHHPAFAPKHWRSHSCLNI